MLGGGEHRGARLFEPGGSQRWSRLFLAADDLTGALDTSAEFVGLFGTISVHWRLQRFPASFALDTGAREAPGDVAATAVAALLQSNPLDETSLAFAKLDSLMRGNPAREIATWLQFAPFDHCIVAPAFPAQARATRAGRQYDLRRGVATLAGTDLAADLRRLGVDVALRRAGQAVPEGVSVWDAESDADLDAIVAGGLARGGRVLWCGCGGLAGALARGAGRIPVQPAPLRGPVLALFGSDHPASAEQFAAFGCDALELTDGGAGACDALSRRLRARGLAAVRLAFPTMVARSEAAERIAREFGRLLNSVPVPATLFVCGGETLRAACGAVCAVRLDLIGRLAPGVPVSAMRGGRFDGVCVVSKSGAFGEPEQVKRLVATAATPGEQGR